MNWEAVGAIGEVLGAAGVIATLAYLARQIRQNTSEVRSAAAQAVHENYANWYQLLAGDTDLSKIVISGARDYSSLPDIEKARFVSTFMAFLSYSQNAFIKWREGSLSPELWSAWELIMMNLLSSPGGADFWRERRYLFGESFRSHVEDVIMKRTPHPDAKPLGVFSIGGELREQAGRW